MSPIIVNPEPRLEGGYGPIITAWDVEQALQATLAAWIDTDLGEIERRSGRAPRSILRPRSWYAVSDYHTTSADRLLPAVLIESAEMASPPAGVEDGRFDGAWEITVAVIAKGKDRAKTRELVALYEAAIRVCLLKRGSLGGFAAGSTLGAARYDAVRADRDRTLAGAEIPVVVTVAGITNRFGGPETPDLPPPTDLPGTSPEDPLHTTTNVTVDEE